MGKQVWKAGNLLYPLPAVMVSSADKSGDANLCTIAWAGTVCSEPPMLSISVRPERYSYHLIKESGEFVVNLPTRDLVRALDWCGVRSGGQEDKWAKMHLTKGKAAKLSYAPVINESPVNIECRVQDVRELGSHHLFLAEVVAVQVEEAYIDQGGRFCMENMKPVTYVHGAYYSLGKRLGNFGFSVQKRKAKHGR